MKLAPLSALFLFAAGGTALTVQDPVATTKPDDKVMLRVTDSNSALELQIGKYFKDVHGWNVDYRTIGDDAADLALELGFSVDGHVPIEFSIDSLPSAIADETVLETRICLRSWFVTRVGTDHPKRSEMLEAINQYTREYWMPHRVYLDGDGDLTLESNINIPGADFPIHPEQIADQVSRSVSAWEALANMLQARGCPLPKD